LRSEEGINWRMKHEHERKSDGLRDVSRLDEHGELTMDIRAEEHISAVNRRA
jgi:hypothetical protein